MPNLVGIGLSQVPTNSMLGGMAYQDPEHASIKDLDLKNLSQINSEIADTTKDVFVYDTRKDSDGGAWRKRTQNTSWYNEPLGTRYRGNRREFPAVAVIVGVLHGIKIYDGDDPDLPLWAYYKRLSWDRDVNSIAARDGKICFTIHTNDAYSGNGFGILDYVKDRQSRNYIGGYSNFKNGFVNDLIASKRETNTYLTLGTNIREFTLIDYNAQDVAMTVLPNAPIDSATGLPVPTIAVGTNGGASIIKDDGNVVDITITTGSNNDADRVDFTDDNRVVIQWGGDSAGEITIDEIQSADISANYPINLPGSHYNDNSPASYSPCFLTEGPSLSNRHPTAIQQFRAVGTSAALSVFEENKESEEDGMVSFISSSYNTGYQQGRIKGAFLSDTDTTNAVGTELVTNGTFDSNISGWTKYDGPDGDGGIVTHNSGKLQVNLNGYYDQGVYQDITVEPNTEYVLVADLDFTTPFNNSNNDVRYIIFPAATNSNASAATSALTSDGRYSLYFKSHSSNTTHRVMIRSALSSNTTGVFTIDNITIKKVERDRSLNNKGLQVFGTITKSAVATGAELVVYSGFSASNYLQQPYNSGLDFGTGDFSIIFWYKLTSTGTPQCFIHRGDGGSGTWGSGPIIQIEMDTLHLDFQLAASGFTSFDEVKVPVAQSATGEWQHFVGVRKGGRMHMYIDGVKYGNTASTRDLSNTAATTWIGQRPNASRPLSNGSMTLLRMSTSVPTAEQIKKIYEDEKFLFHENAKATLYGSSDAVTALAFDDTTNLLHVGTSAGRSEFQGLRRINNTTTAVTTAISASNGLVAEQ